MRRRIVAAISSVLRNSAKNRLKHLVDVDNPKEIKEPAGKSNRFHTQTHVSINTDSPPPPE